MATLSSGAWYDGNSGNETHPVDERAESHPFGLFGMHGNVWEWCRDVYDANAYRKRVDGWDASEWSLAQAGDDARYRDDEARKRRDPSRVLRGGSWCYTARFCRSASRIWIWPVVRFGYNGFRVSLVRGPAAGRGASTDGKATAEPAPGDGGRGTRPESDGAGGAAGGLPDLAAANFPREAGRKKTKKPGSS